VEVTLTVSLLPSSALSFNENALSIKPSGFSTIFVKSFH